MPDDEPVDPAAVTADATAIDDALAAFEDACAQLADAAADAVGRPHARLHLAAVRDRLATVSVPVTSATADALVVSAADTRAALQQVLVPEDEDEDELGPEQDDTADEEEDPADTEEEPAAPDPELDLAPEAAEHPPAPRGYRACTALPTRNVPHVLVFEDDRWQRAAIVFAADDTLTVRTATARQGPGRPLDEYTPARIARPYAQA